MKTAEVAVDEQGIDYGLSLHLMVSKYGNPKKKNPYNDSHAESVKGKGK